MLLPVRLEIDPFVSILSATSVAINVFVIYKLTINYTLKSFFWPLLIHVCLAFEGIPFDANIHAKGSINAHVFIDLFSLSFCFFKSAMSGVNEICAMPLHDLLFRDHFTPAD